MYLNVVFKVILGQICFRIVGGQSTPETQNEITKLYKEREIIPDLFEAVAPKNIVKCSYGNIEVNFGNNISLLQSMKKPTSCEWPTTEGGLYSLVLLGLDSPSYEFCYEREYNHWLVGNIPETRLDEGYTIAEYQGGQIAYTPGEHRLVFVVYKQPEKLKFNETILPEMSDFWSRVLFTHQGFSRKYGLGMPHASNYFNMTFKNSQTW